MTEYKQKRLIDGKKPRLAILNGEGMVIDKNPSKVRLSLALLWNFKYNETGICPRCREEDTITEKSILDGNVCKEKDKNGKKTGRWICENHWKKDHERYNPNSTRNARKSIANCRTGNQNLDHSSTKGDRHIDLACMIYGWEDLNKKNDNYSVGTQIDRIDSKTGLYHQVRGRSLGILSTYITINGEKIYYEGWNFTDLDDEWHKKYEDMVCFCKSNDGKRIERIYRIPHLEIDGRKSIGIYKYGNGWYEQYRITDEEMKKANDTTNSNYTKAKS